MQKKYKSKVSFTKKKGKKTIKYKNGARVQESTFDTPLRGTTAPITSTGFQVMDDMEGVDVPVGGNNESGKGGNNQAAIAGISAAADMGSSMIPETELGAQQSTGAAGSTIGGIREGVASAIPIAGMFHEVSEMGMKAAQQINEGAKGEGYLNSASQSLFSPSQGITDSIDRAQSSTGKDKATAIGSVAANWILPGLGGAIYDGIAASTGATTPEERAKTKAEHQDKVDANNQVANDYLASIGEQQLYANGGKMKDTKSYSVGGTLGEITKKVNEDKNYFANNITGYNKKYTHIVNNPDKYTTEELVNATNVIQASFPSDANSINTADNASPYPNTARTTTFSNGGKNHSATIKLDSELTKFFGPSHKDGGIKLGTNSKGQKIEVEGGETAKDGFIHSDNIGYTKSGEPTPDAKKTVTTFAAKAKQIENKFKGRPDDISNVTKKRLFDKVEKDNTKVGPIADAMEGNPQTEGKFENGKFVNGKWVKGEETEVDEVEFGLDPVTNKYIDKTLIQRPQEEIFNTPLKKSGQITSTAPVNNTVVNNNRTAKTTKKTTEKVGFSTGDYLNMASSLPAIGYNFGKGAQKATRDNLHLNPESSKIKGMMADRRINMQALQNKLTGERTAGMKAIGENTRSVGSRNANLQNLFANSAQRKAELEMKSQDVNNKYRGEEANTLNNLGQQEARERLRKMTADQQHDAVKESFIGQGFAELGEGLKNTGNAFNAKAKNNMTAESVNALSVRYGLSKNKINSLMNSGGFDSEEDLVQYLSLKDSKKSKKTE